MATFLMFTSHTPFHPDACTFRINGNLRTYQLHATDEGQGAPASAAPHGLLLLLCPRAEESLSNSKISSCTFTTQIPEGRPAGWQPS